MGQKKTRLKTKFRNWKKMDRQLIQQFLLTCIIPPPTSQPPKRAKTERRKRMWGASTVYSLRRPMHSSMHIIYRRRNTYFLLSVQKTEWLQLMAHVHGWRPQYITRSQSVLGLCCPPHQRSFLVTTVLQFCCPPSPSQKLTGASLRPNREELHYPTQYFFNHLKERQQYKI